MPLGVLFSTPVWGPGPVLFLSACLLGLWVRARQRIQPWDLQRCPTDLTGKTAVVTGANSGIGKVVCQELARRGARVVLACRDPERGRRALADIQAASGSGRLLLGELDVSSLASVRRFVQWLLQEEPEIHLLVNNAAISGILPKTLTPEGLDVTFATNYIGPFLLTNLLRGALQRAGSARVVNVSSYRQAFGFIDEQHLTGAGRPLRPKEIYDCTKLLLTSFSAELARRLDGTGIAVNSVEPGIVYTDIMKHYSWFYRFLFWLSSFFIKSPRHGAIPVLYLSLARELDGISGKHFNSSCVVSLPAEAAQDPHTARSLWSATVRLTSLDKMD
ncbi:PREDICTED: retinol dehydrogenase 11-like [Elephantulus edwardii]|uniref:retinol dehydrogenase 11-like n=1 Tax=Elephantulus edwardii TaxID=28737 RepID=UPI0003F0D0EE|nr:PREDICTED: retinol dehydrogenase 11-like [Elephantulus edwardii]